VPAGALADSAEAMPLASNVKDLVRQDLDALVGWMLNGGS